MSITYLSTFLHLTKPKDPIFNRFFQNSVRRDQNNLSAASNLILHNGNLYTFLPFIYQGAAKTDPNVLDPSINPITALVMPPANIF